MYLNRYTNFRPSLKFSKNIVICLAAIFMMLCVCFSVSAAEEEGVCARVRIRISQDVVIARNAFKATLEISNSPENVPLENLKVTLNITDGNNQPANDLFGIHPPELSGIGDVNGGGIIQPGGSATAAWLLVPTRDAAPDEPVMYFVGGEFSYTQAGSTITMPLFPAPILVKPDPLLVLDYFWVRDVYSDDPFTPEIEPAEPFPLGLMVRNNGKGVANNFRITSSQPEIVENEKGLLIDFKIISTQVNSEPVSPSLTATLGNIDPGTISVVKWMMTSSLQGKFIEYKATFEHVDGLGIPRLSIIDTVNIHELTHAVRVDTPSDDNKPDFLVNDIPDDDHLPDTLYNSAGPIEAVGIGLNPSVDSQIVNGHLEAHLTASVPTGWVYIRTTDPGQDQFRLTRVVRSDGREILLDDNAWTTHRTIRLVGQAPYREHLLHLFDKDSTGSYTLIYESSGINNPPNVPSSPSPADGVTDIAVNVALNWQGGDPDAGDTVTYDVYLDTSNPPVTKVSSNQSEISYQAMGLSYGTTYYWKIVARDNNGSETEGPVWSFTTLLKEKFTLTVSINGSGSGKVSDGKNINCTYNGTTSQGTCSDLFNSGDTVLLTATPDAGSSFAGWSGDCSGTDLSTSILMNGTKTCTATFNDAIAPVSKVTQPTNGTTTYANSYIIKGTADDGVGSGVQKVEVSTDGGSTWSSATGTTSWSYVWTILGVGTYNIKSRATDIAGNVEAPGSGVTVTVVQRQATPVTINGRQLLVNGSPFTIKGVGYSPVPIGDDPETMPPYGDYFTSDYSSIYDRDLPLLRDVGANTVRLWNWNNIADHFDFLEKAYNGGVNPTYVIAGYRIDSGLDIDPNSSNNVREQLKADFREMVAVHKKHPAILMWAIGNGLNADGMYGSNLDNLFSLINEMAAEAHAEEGSNYHPVTTALVDVDMINIISTYDTSIPTLDIWAANVYRGNTFGSLFNDYKAVSTKPFVILEYGIDAYDNVHKNEYEKIGIPYQADYAEALWKEIATNSDICIGGSIVEYSDEWWKGKFSTDLGCTDIDPEVHGICGYAMSSHPDGYSNEEWWGLMRIIDNGTNPDIMESRAVYNRLQSLWIRAITVEKTGTGSGTVTSSDGKINCGSDCSETYNTVTEITLTAMPDTGSVFGGWSGCTPTPEDPKKCTVIISNTITVKATFQKDTYPPTGSIVINGDAQATNNRSVVLTLSASDDSGGSIQMCISNTSSCASWEPFATTKSWSLTSGNGTKTVYARFRDQWGNVNTTPSDTIILDTVAPVNGTVTATPGNTQVRLNWQGFTDALSGIDSYKVVYSTKSAPRSCSSGTAIYTGTDTMYPHTGLTNGTTYYYLVCAIDKAGNMSSGATTSVRPIPETNPPTGSIVINGDAQATNNRSVVLTLSASDDSGGSIQMCINNTSSCASWEPFATTKSWSLTSGNGTKTVYARFRDQWGNVNTTPSDTIILDTVAPVNGTVTATPGNTQVRLNWKGFTDALSGIDSYKVVYSTKSAPRSCSSGTAIYTGTDTTYPHTGLTNGTTYYYLVCAIDKAGNMSSGAKVSARPQL